MANILALDQASITSGYAVFVDGEYYAHGKFTYDDTDIGIRLYKIREKVRSLIDEYKIDEVFFEGIQVQGNISNNIATYKVLAEVYGIVEELCTELKLPHTSVMAEEWRSTLKIKGKDRTEKKRNTQKYVLDNYNIKATQDECDAIGIGLHAVKRPKGFDWS